MSKIAIVGMQHQGYILAAGFASLGHDVSAVGYRVGMPNEPGLKEMIDNPRITFISNIKKAVTNADFVFLSQDIAFDEKGVNMLPIFLLADEIEKFRPFSSILCVTTQVPVGTSKTLTRGRVAYIPELLRPGQSVDNFKNADRIIIGGDNFPVIKSLFLLYQPLKRPIMCMSIRSAEMAKHAHNAILATQISFINEMDKICQKVGADIDDVARAIKADGRVGEKSYLNPGWTLRNGHAIRDVRVLQTLGVPTPLMDAVIAVEDSLDS